MKKCYVIIVDTLNDANFNSKKVKNIINDALIDDSDLFDDKMSYLASNVVVIEFDKDGENLELQRALQKKHLFVNILSDRQNEEVDILHYEGSQKNVKALRTHNISLIEHAFTGRSGDWRNLYLMCLEDGRGEMAADRRTKIVFRGIKIDIRLDQLVYVKPADVRSRPDAQIRQWLLARLASLGSSYPFLCLPALLRLQTGFPGLIPLSTSTPCSPHNYGTLLAPIIGDQDHPSRPILILCRGDHEAIEEAVLCCLAARPGLSPLVYRARRNLVCQDVSVLLAEILRLFKVAPQADRLPFTPVQMATLVSDCLRTGGGLPLSKTLLLVVEDLDWISTSDLPGLVCSWLPERCASNIIVVLLAAPNSPQQKSLFTRLLPPLLLTLPAREASCHSSSVSHWCQDRLSRMEDIFRRILTEACFQGHGPETLRILTLFHVSPLCTLTLPQLLILLGSASPQDSSSTGFFQEKGDCERAEKHLSVPDGLQTSHKCPQKVERALCHLVTRGILLSRPKYSLASGHLRAGLRNVCPPSVAEEARTDLLSMLTRDCTNLRTQVLFVPLVATAGSGSGLLRAWLLRPTVMAALTDEHAAPALLLRLWRLVLGPDTDYREMLSGYLSVEEANGKGVPFGKARCRRMLRVARLAMQAGLYPVAKSLARHLLKALDRPRQPGCPVLAACLHLLFCTLDERLKTFEFVSERTTPLFRRTVHYGARALLVQAAVVEGLRAGVLDDPQRRHKLCVAEGRLARVMTHFVFALDGVDQAAVSRNFPQARIRAVAAECLSRALEVATRLRDESLLLEVLMTYGVIQSRDRCREKVLLYKTPLRLALCAYGHSHVFVSRICINIGISYEEHKSYARALQYFTLWSHITHELLGRSHCKAVRSCAVFKEPIFKITADFIDRLNGEPLNDNLEDELKSIIGRHENAGDEENLDLSVAGVSVLPVGDGALSTENMFAARAGQEQEDDWEVQSSDDETPDYTAAFEQVIETFHKPPASTNPLDTDRLLLKSILESSRIDPDDLSPQDISFLHQSQQSAADALRLSSSSPSAMRLAADLHGYDGTIMEAIRITRMFRGLQDLSQLFPQSVGSSAELSLASRLLELQRDLQDFLGN